MIRHPKFDSWPRVHLLSSDVEFCEDLGRRTQADHDRRGSSGTGGAPFTGPLSLELNIRGIFGECALWHFYRPLGLVWNQGKFPRDGGPDIGDNIDAKERSSDTDDLIFNRSVPIHDDWIYQMVFGHLHPTYVIGPWIYGRDVNPKLNPHRKYELRGTDDPRRAAIYIEQTDPALQPPHTHYKELERVLRPDDDYQWF